MPLPSPNDDETKDQWMDRCMGDSAMLSEYPDDAQRAAVCDSIWSDARTAPNVERRFSPPGELRVTKEKGKPTRIGGYAAVFNKPSVDFGGFTEVIAAGAFGPALEAKPDVRALFNHDPNYVLARTKSGTLRVWQDAKGLPFELDLPDTQQARDIAASMERGDIDQCSFAFVLAPEGDAWENDDEMNFTRVIKNVAALYDVSVVTYPAYPDTSAALRSLEAAKKSTATVAPDAEMPRDAQKAEEERRARAAKANSAWNQYMGQHIKANPDWRKSQRDT